MKKNGSRHAGHIVATIMRWTAIITTVICSTALAVAAYPAKGQSPLDEKFTLTLKNVPLREALDKISAISGVPFMYGGDLAQSAVHVSIQAENRTLRFILDQTLLPYPYSYRVVDEQVLIRYNPEKPIPTKKDPQPGPSLLNKAAADTLSGVVTDTAGVPLPGVAVTVKGTANGTLTGLDGQYMLSDVEQTGMLEFNLIGFQPQEIPVNARTTINVALRIAVSELDETVVIGYGTTTQRLNTSSVSKVSSETISRQPVSNPLAALQGRVPGLTVVQGNGIPGSSFKVQIRGQNALAIGSVREIVNSDPLFVIDGVPFAPNNTSINTISSTLGQSAGQGLSPFYSLTPADIESIEVLKDADATAIYGSRGGNGVILITTKKGSVGKPRLGVNVSSGLSSIARPVDMMNTRQYLEMREEAFANDAVTPSRTNAPDIMVYEPGRYTDFPELMTGSNAQFTNLQASLSGGNTYTQFLVNGTYNYETTVYPGDMSAGRASALLNLNHISPDQRFKAMLSASFNSSENTVAASSFKSTLTLMPNLPTLRDENGNLAWEYDGVSFENPLAALLQDYTARTENLLGNLQLQYRLLPGLTLKSSLGYNSMKVNEVNINPITSQNPLYSPQGYSNFGDNAFRSWILEPQARYVRQAGAGQLDILVGATWQETTQESKSIFAYGYANDGLLGSLSAATSLFPASSSYQYRYQAFFGRVNYNWNDTYIINLTGRRDGSSRFGPGRQFSSFGAVGAAWIFSEEPFIENALPFLSYGKLRGSWGVTGTDQIGNYQYLESWQSTGNPYDGSQGLYPSRLANPDYGWEENQKLEVAIELGLLKDRVLITTAYYRNQSDNHLISYNLPSQVGFTSITRNFPASVQNSGVEIGLNTQNVVSEPFSWTTAFNISIPENRLVSFPGIESSSYGNTYVVGKSLSVLKGYEFLGVDPASGVFRFNDRNRDGTFNADDRIVFGDLDPDFYGGLNNSFRYRNWQLDVFFQFVKQMGSNYLNAVYTQVPGTMRNMPAVLMNRWQQPGDQTSIQKFTTTPSSEAYRAVSTFRTIHSGLYSDASFTRLKNLNLSYSFPSAWLQKLKIENCRIFIQGQNLWTITGYEQGDPETQDLYGLPVLRTLIAGIQVAL